MRINSISFGMKFSPNTEKLINAAHNDCITYKQEAEYKKCVNFLEKTFPEKTLDIKTEFFKPKGFFERLFGKSGYYDKAYIDGKPFVMSKIQTIREEKIENERLVMVGGLVLPQQDVSVTHRRENNLERLIALSNAILINYFADINRFPFISNKKFLG